MYLQLIIRCQTISNSHNFHYCPSMLPEKSIQYCHQVSLSVCNSNGSRNIQWSLQMLRHLFVCKEISLILRTFIRKCYHCVHSVLMQCHLLVQFSDLCKCYDIFIYRMLRTIAVVAMYVYRYIKYTRCTDAYICKACCSYTLQTTGHNLCMTCTIRSQCEAKLGVSEDQNHQMDTHCHGKRFYDCV